MSLRAIPKVEHYVARETSSCPIKVNLDYRVAGSRLMADDDHPAVAADSADQLKDARLAIESDRKAAAECRRGRIGRAIENELNRAGNVVLAFADRFDISAARIGYRRSVSGKRTQLENAWNYEAAVVCLYDVYPVQYARSTVKFVQFRAPGYAAFVRTSLIINITALRNRSLDNQRPTLINNPGKSAFFLNTYLRPDKPNRIVALLRKPVINPSHLLNTRPGNRTAGCYGKNNRRRYR